ncbi:MAG: bifunctional phosphopantothenoylcysteine decarboxylase/phosphopantothenate--cysteine ligase CoaBC, partial [Polyangiaceae bacterium]|nr:bifunctional phosphopantothenoylcysteine decarboxylase/phosphopantothenate--cysteine ligase CoaBC [Polyangiaceae bacterium]
MSARRIVVGIGGGIAAYKAVHLVRELGRRGAETRVVLTRSAARFVGKVTFAGLTGTPAVDDLWDPSYAGEVHIELGKWADAMVIAPATMNLLARAATGFADDAVLATLACARGPVLFAPAMHHRMWGQASTQRSVALLRDAGYRFVGPVEGALASGEVGMGRMCEPEAIADAVFALLETKRDLAGVRVLITAGPTVEDLDPVRFLGNRSTGKMGFAIAERALARGASVTLVAGPVQLASPTGAEVVRVRSALEMQAAVEARVASSDVIVMSAAVADYRPAEVSTEKMKKAGEDLSIALVRNPDILAGLGAARTGRHPLLVGFAVETTDVVRYARDKL